MRPCSGYWSCGLSLGMIVSDLWYVCCENMVVTVVGGCGCEIGVCEIAVCCGWEVKEPVVQRGVGWLICGCEWVSNEG